MEEFLEAIDRSSTNLDQTKGAATKERGCSLVSTDAKRLSNTT